jgi:hypothetical protein
MRWLARAALAALGSVTTLFIACAYGVPWRYSKSGHVLDATTRQGITGIQVACVDAQGQAVRETRSASGGVFSLGVDSCDALAFSDVDGAANGAYAPTTVPFTPQDESGMVVALEPVP